MGTPEQRAHRQAYIENLQRAFDAATRGTWTSDQDLQSYLGSIGQNPTGPLYKQLYSGGGYATYGPSWDPIYNFDFEHHQKIPWMGPGESWYDPSVASNWQNTPALQDARIRGFYNWRDQNMGNIDQRYGGNALVAWLRGRAGSSQPNSPDMSWTGTDWSRPAVNPFAATGSEAPAPPGPIGQSAQTAAPGLTGTDAFSQTQDALRRKYGTTLAGLTGSY